MISMISVDSSGLLSGGNVSYIWILSDNVGNSLLFTVGTSLGFSFYPSAAIGEPNTFPYEYHLSIFYNYYQFQHVINPTLFTEMYLK